MSEKRKFTPKEKMNMVLAFLGLFAISLLPIAGGGANSVNPEMTKDGIAAVPAPLEPIDMSDATTGTPTRIGIVHGETSTGTPTPPRPQPLTPTEVPTPSPLLAGIPSDQRQ